MKIFNKKFLSVSFSVLVSVLFVSAVVYAQTTVGLNIETGGNLLFNGSTSGTVTVKPQAEAGTWSLTLPANDGTAGQVLSTDGTGITSWITGGIASITGDLVDNTDPVNPVVSRPYKVYTALLTQSGTDAPVATVLENTLGGNIVWTRYAAGRYAGTLNGAFTSGKTFIFNQYAMVDNSNQLRSYSTYISTNDVYLHAAMIDQDGTMYVDDDLIYESFPIEIRVYP